MSPLHFLTSYSHFLIPVSPTCNFLPSILIITIEPGADKEVFKEGRVGVAGIVGLQNQWGMSPQCGLENWNLIANCSTKNTSNVPK